MYGSNQSEPESVKRKRTLDAPRKREGLSADWDETRPKIGAFRTKFGVEEVLQKRLT